MGETEQIKTITKNNLTYKKCLTYDKKSVIVPVIRMADVAQLVRALVCGTRCRRFESDLPPHTKKRPLGRFFCFNHKTYYI